MAQKIAVIDLGTNTFNLLIAFVEDANFEHIYHTKTSVGLGLGEFKEKIILPDSILRAIDALSHFKSICDEHDVAEIRAIGTSAIRDAINKDEFCKLVYKKLNIEIKVISGLEEATLIYKGVKCSYDFVKPALIMDIGGGSTEFIYANKLGVEKAMSLNIGTSRIFQTLNLNDPFTDADIELIENWLEENTNNALDAYQSDILIGSSGTFETIYEIHHQQAFPKSEKCIQLPLADFQHILDKIIKSTLEERQANPFIIPIRQLMIPIAAVKVNWIIRKVKVQEILISPYSLKEGALF